MISCQQLTFSYSPQKKFNFSDFSCQDGETLLILGRSGKGKTTLLHLLALLLTPESGSIQVNQVEVSKFNAAQAAKMRAEHIGIIYQRPHFVHALSVMDNLLLSNYLAGQKQDKNRAKLLAEHLGFADHLNKQTTQLSLGEQQRVGIARALMNNPNLILADEPTSSLDDENCDNVIRLLTKQTSEIGASLVVVTHDQRLKDKFSNQISL
ncbi:MAG: ATP-binding cassette domain-containing protein [Spirosomataceae bacterium]